MHDSIFWHLHGVTHYGMYGIDNLLIDKLSQQSRRGISENVVVALTNQLYK